MTDRQPFSYVVLRYRHDALAGELVNVGVVLYAAGAQFLRAAVRTTYGRLSKLYPDFEGSALTADLRRLETALNRFVEGDVSGMFASDYTAGSFAKRVIDDPAGSYIWSDVQYGITKSPSDELQRLYERFVGRFEHTQIAGRSDADIWRPARDKLMEKQLSAFLEQKTIRSNRDEVSFDHAWKNGVWHCFQPLSFDLKDADSIKNKAAKWVGHMVGLSTSEEEFRPYFIVGKPSESKLSSAFERAVAFLAEAPSPNAPTVIREDEIEAFVEGLEQQMQIHVDHR